MYVSNKGLVSWWTRSVLKTYCNFDLKDYPFDAQTCNFGFGSWSYDSTGVKILIHDKYPQVIYGPYQKNPEWTVLKTELREAYINITEKGTWDSLWVSIQLQRRNNIYFFSVVLPYLSGCLFGFLSFMEEIGSGRRIAFSIMSITIFLFLLLLLSIQLGSHSISVPYAVKCCSVSLTVVSSGLIISLLLRSLMLKLSEANIPPPRIFTSFLENVWIQRIFCLSSSVVSGGSGRAKSTSSGPNQFFNESESDETGIIGRNGGDIEGSIGVQQLQRNIVERMGSSNIISRDWMILCHFIDRICFYGFIVVAMIYHS